MSQQTTSTDTRLETLRHSCAHLMAHALKRLFPKEKIELGIGPVIQHGFYYDFLMERKLTQEDFPQIEEMMRTIIKEALPITSQKFSKKEALAFYENAKEPLKVELIESFSEAEEVSFYTQGDFTDLCRGPHMQNTAHILPYFKIYQVAGAYWRGDETRPMMQRLYAFFFSTEKKLKDHLFFLEEAEKRDHRKLGKELELFLFDSLAPGSPFFLPHGAFIYNELVAFIRRLYTTYDYKEVITPQILDSELWHKSGHYAHYKENMYLTNCDKKEFAVKPMNCPCHMLMFSHGHYSYRDLPLRFADFGRLHRYERSGTLAGLTRVRTFCQDDAHIFLGVNQIQAEIKMLLEMFMRAYEHFGFNKIKINLSTRPLKKEDRAGDDTIWDLAEKALEEALKESGHPYFIKEGDGAFYGPKIDIEIADALERYHQLGTVQLDFVLPQKFDLKFTNPQGVAEQPVVIHRALLGSLERFIGVYIEHTGGAFPFWMSPVQAVIVPINSENHSSYCHDFAKKCEALGLRVKVDDRNESMNFKTREIQTKKIPFMLAVGDREIASNSFSVRKYGEKTSETKSGDDVLELFKNLDHQKILKGKE
ncbi:MAG: threonine--tRNA ligase [Bacteriovoracaceae bacterium]|nr:threonine--tRNA ligase [Bacteriovoracaceae bacterium]